MWRNLPLSEFTKFMTVLPNFGMDNSTVKFTACGEISRIKDERQDQAILDAQPPRF